MTTVNEVTAEQDGIGAEDRIGADLLSRVAAGDHPAFAELYARYASRVHGVVLTVLRDRAQASEVTQEVFLQLWQQAARFQAGRSSAKGWITRVAHARAVDRVRLCQSSSVRDTRYLAARHIADYDTVIEEILHRDDQSAVRAALHRLAPLQRESIVLAYYAGLSTAEISAQLGVNRSTVKTRIRDGLRKLAADLRPAPEALA